MLFISHFASRMIAAVGLGQYPINTPSTCQYNRPLNVKKAFLKPTSKSSCKSMSSSPCVTISSQCVCAKSRMSEIQLSTFTYYIRNPFLKPVHTQFKRISFCLGLVSTLIILLFYILVLVILFLTIYFS